jgi:hypothetical protein
LGRTEIIRTCGSDAAEFVRSMLSNLSHSENAKLLIKAIQSHREFIDNAINMNSFDRHLFGLKLVALENNIELPNLYKCDAFEKLNHFYISSSLTSSKFEAVTTFGPLCEDGYGASYNIMENKIIFGLSSLNSCEKTSAKLLAHNINQALVDCQNLLLNFKQILN